MPLLLGALLVASFVLSLAFVPLMMRVARRTGFLDHPGPRKIHTEPIPYGGGLAVAAAMLIPIAAGVLAAWLVARGTTFGLPAEITRHAPGVLHRLRELVVLLSGGLVILLLGLVDDKRRLGPGIKFLVQFLVAAGFVIGAERLSLFWEGSLAGDLVGGAVTALWIVGVTNAFNLLDHMDGLTGGVGAIACAAFGIVAIVTGQWFLAAALAALLGACVGFLCFNFPPARVFLGDAGSLFIGYILATLTVTFTFYARDRAFTYAMPLAILAVPLFDTASVMIIRLRAGKPLWVGDRNHLAHRLLALGMSRRTTVLTIYAITLSAAFASVLLLEVDGWLGAGLILAQLLLTFVLITLLESAGRSRGDDTTG